MSPADPLPPIDDSDTSGHLTREDIQKFKRLIKETTGYDLTDQEAWNRATELVTLYRIFLGPLPEDPEVNHSPSPGPPPEAGHNS